MDRELLIEICCEELPAAWLPDLTVQMRDQIATNLALNRLAADAPVESYSTPRRLTVRIARIADRQPDLEEVLNGPPVSVALGPDGRPTPAAVGFARKHWVEVDALVRVDTPKGPYLAHRTHQRGKTAIDVLPAVMAGLLRSLTFPRARLLTAARTSNPCTSSITAAARITLLDLSASSPRAASTRAVIPTLVATIAAPTKIASV